MFGQGAMGQMAIGQPEDEFPPALRPVTGAAEFTISAVAVAEFDWQAQLDVVVEVTQ